MEDPIPLLIPRYMPTRMLEDKPRVWLVSAVESMEMNISVSGAGNCNLLQKTKDSIDELSFWAWSDLLVALKHYQDSPRTATSSGVLEKCLDSLVGRLAMASEVTPCASTSPPDSSGLRISFNTRSTQSSNKGLFRATWWFEDLSALSPNLIEMLVKSMVSRGYNHKSKFYTASSDEKREVLEIVIDMLYTLDPSSISCKSLFGVLRPVLRSNISKSCRNKLESMIGSQLDQATIDNLLIPSYGRSYLYDVNLVLRFLKAFLRDGGSELSPIRMKNVASLIDLYITEVAPDRCLKSSKFSALVMVLPDSSRDSWDELYHAMDIYLEVHTGLSEVEKMEICGGLNYKKLSSEACMHLSQNTKFPSTSAVQALISQQWKLKNLLEGMHNAKHYTDFTAKEDRGREQVVVYNEKLRAQLQGMQWRVMELEKVCKKMQTQMAKIMKAKVLTHSNARPLPRLCS
ncbi:hypothetical protein GOBAR_AA17947 [Gossypium barbadense]|uniref:NPH3 domain-containing protein n=1 Tax=Gossypium barbadense TaxID=3634 RepID=A0A2P5XH90_GOSBA|nr:hypothetical protein GOBAR_AA17947 [Gossypium barbadense]